ncbi:alpha/beta fold hydrolase [Atopomonas sediminilitoris]|uniref:alpha/beta fold hydrolase n=1 Tax=Atopomonas sediminilitoris TaxID=2919919 RepID=UPI001F4EB493|nr:alpha/beta hydrolase [Atopomonas sediminilitoris]MCJ8167990.1 alpha/beta hydrolase [Atopomonas sediminilitoris]
MAYFTHQGCRLYYEVHGHGEPLLLIHGLGSSTRDWEYQVPHLAAHYQVICMDVRGHGQSDKPRERYRIAAFADDVRALIEHLNLTAVHYLGISMGGMIGFQLASQHPQLLKSLVIVNSSPEVKVNTLNDRIQVIKRLLLARVLGLNTLGKALGKMLFPKPEQQELRDKIAQRWPENDKRAYLSALHAIIGWGVREHLPEINVPTLIISADHDYTPVSLKQAYTREMANARLVVIEDSRHATPLDQPERFNQCVLNFLHSLNKETQHA